MDINELRELATHKYPTPELALEAVIEDEYELQFIHNQTPEICLAAVNQSRSAIEFVNPDCLIHKNSYDGQVV